MFLKLFCAQGTGRRTATALPGDMAAAFNEKRAEANNDSLKTLRELKDVRTISQDTAAA